MLVEKSDRIAHTQGLIVVFCLVGLEQRDITPHQLIGSVHIAEDLRAHRLAGLLAAVYIDLRTLFLALALVEDPQRNAHAHA